MSDEKGNKGWFGFLKHILKTEWDTDFGKFNMATEVLIIFWIVIYTARDWIINIIYAICNTIKSCVLKKNIPCDYNSPSYLVIASPLIIVTVLCLGYIGIHEYKKIKIEEKTKNK